MLFSETKCELGKLILDETKNELTTLKSPFTGLPPPLDTFELYTTLPLNKKLAEQQPIVMLEFFKVEVMNFIP
tara:strand:+ start:337 stop:555 length:219 start_codon:yes stop_codon:yes gene_type:complete